MGKANQDDKQANDFNDNYMSNTHETPTNDDYDQIGIENCDSQRSDEANNQMEFSGNLKSKNYTKHSASNGLSLDQDNQSAGNGFTGSE